MFRKLYSYLILPFLLLGTLIVMIDAAYSEEDFEDPNDWPDQP